MSAKIVINFTNLLYCKYFFAKKIATKKQLQIKNKNYTFVERSEYVKN
jgi:hypothetical protein